MASNEQGPVLRVEGDDDKHTIIHLVKWHGFARETHTWFPSIEAADGIEKLLKTVKTQTKSSTDRVVGFVLDADESSASRWQSVRDRLLKVGFNNDQVPEEHPPEGFIGYSRQFKSRVGVWIMPDNRNEGALEDFLLALVDQADPVFAHATEATDTAKKLGATFADKDRDKARLHAWLAWQEKPGCPYGIAIEAKYFRHDSELAGRFVKWFSTLYDPSNAGALP